MFAVRQMKRSRRQREDAWRRGGGAPTGEIERRRSANFIRLSRIDSAERCTFPSTTGGDGRQSYGRPPPPVAGRALFRRGLKPIPSFHLPVWSGRRPLTSALLQGARTAGPSPRSGGSVDGHGGGILGAFFPSLTFKYSRGGCQSHTNSSCQADESGRLRSTCS